MRTARGGVRWKGDADHNVQWGQREQSAARAEFTVTILFERVVVVLLVLLPACVLAMEEDVELFTGVLLQKMHDHLRYTQPLMRFHGTEAINREGEDEEEPTHCPAQMYTLKREMDALFRGGWIKSKARHRLCFAYASNQRRMMVQS